MAVISIGDGRFIEHQEGALRLPPPVAPKPRKERWGVEGLNAYSAARSAQVSLTTELPKLSKTHKVDREVANALWAEAQRRATIDMENIKKDIDLQAAAAEALEAVLVTMRAPINQPTKLTAARTILEWTMPKPTAKSEVTVNAAEKWLEGLSE